MNRYRRILAAALAAVMLLALTACGQSADTNNSAEQTVVRIGTPATGDHGARMLEAARVAAEKQYFEEELAKVGCRPEYVGFDGAGPAVNEAMISGDLDVAIYGDMPALVLASKFSGVTFIAMDNSAVQQGIVVQKDAGINSVEDLRGKRVIAETGTTCQKFLISLLESAGMTQDDVQQINATTANAQVEFAAGEADAVVLPCMAAYRLIDEKGVGTMLAVAGNDERLDSQYVVSARNDFLEKNPDAAAAIIRALSRAQAFAAENPEEIYSLFADSNYSADVYRSVYSFDTSFSYFDPEITPVCVEKLKSLNDYALEKGLISSSVDIDAIVDTSYYQAAMGEQRMSAYDYSDRAKPASAHTKAVNAQLAHELGLEGDAPAWRELELAREGLVRAAEDLVIRDGDGHVIWDLDAFRFLQSPVPDERVNPSLWMSGRANLIAGLFEVVPEKIYQVRGFDLANLTLVRSQTGWIVLDCTTNVETARAAMAFASETLGEDIPARVRAVIISHSNLDHYGGLRGVTDPARLGTEVPVYVPAGYDVEVVREHVYAGAAMSRRKKFQVGSRGEHSGPLDIVSTGIGLTHPTGHASFARSTVYIERDCTLTIDGLDVAFMLTPETEAPAEMINYFPAYRALWMAELCNGTLHNLYPIRGAQVRDSAAWSRYLTDALVRWGDGTDVVFQSHNWPHRNTPGHPEGNDFVRNTAAAYRWIHDQTLLLANQGLTPQEIARRVELPPELARCGYLRPYYGTVEVNCRAVYQKYLGFYDGNPVHLNPLPDTESAKRYVDYMGGADEILRRAEEDFAAGDYQWVAEVTQRVVFADPACRRARQLCADAMEQLGYQAESGIWRNAYLAAAEELRFGTREAHLKRGNGQILQSLSPDFLLDYLGIVLDGERAQALSLRLNLLVTDGGETYRYLLELRCGTLLVYHGGRDDAARTLTVTKDVLAALVHKQLDTVQGQIPDADMELLRGIETYVTDLDHQPPFHVVEP